MSNPEVDMTLTEAVAEVLNALEGTDLTYDPELDRFRSITRSLNRAVRAIALEKEWSWYVSSMNLGFAPLGEMFVILPDGKRPRVINDDAVRLIDGTGTPREWAYFLPRDALHKYAARGMLRCAITRNLLQFNRPFTLSEADLEIVLPIMREPVLHRLPALPEDPVDQAVLDQLIDFAYPDLIVARAAYMYALSDPVMQPRAPTLEQGYKTLLYAIVEREDQNTDTPYQNEFFVPVQNGIYPESSWRPWPLADERR